MRPGLHPLLLLLPAICQSAAQFRNIYREKTTTSTSSTLSNLFPVTGDGGRLVCLLTVTSDLLTITHSQVLDTEWIYSLSSNPFQSIRWSVTVWTRLKTWRTLRSSPTPGLSMTRSGTPCTHWRPPSLSCPPLTPSSSWPCASGRCPVEGSALPPASPTPPLSPPPSLSTAPLRRDLSSPSPDPPAPHSLRFRVRINFERFKLFSLKETTTITPPETQPVEAEVSSASVPSYVSSYPEGFVMAFTAEESSSISAHSSEAEGFVFAFNNHQDSSSHWTLT